MADGRSDGWRRDAPNSLPHTLLLLDADVEDDVPRGPVPVDLAVVPPAHDIALTAAAAVGLAFEEGNLGR